MSNRSCIQKTNTGQLSTVLRRNLNRGKSNNLSKRIRKRKLPKIMTRRCSISSMLTKATKWKRRMPFSSHSSPTTVGKPWKRRIRTYHYLKPNAKWLRLKRTESKEMNSKRSWTRHTSAWPRTSRSNSPSREQSRCSLTNSELLYSPPENATLTTPVGSGVCPFLLSFYWNNE